MQDRLSVLFSFKRVEKTFSTGVLPKYRMFQEHYGHIPLICLVFFSHVINKPESFRKRHSSLFTLHIPAVIIINRTIPNINTNSQIYYKECKEDLEIFLCGSPVNRYIDYHVLSFFFRKNGACYRLLPTLGYNA